uniref:IRG-type G domain-containing protein n=1 Tax=Tetraodon nigroviridis TaxID=99883 RepID=H3C674_TETNG
IKEALLNDNKDLDVAKIQEHLERTANIPLNIGITGESGSGKSSFVNAFRGVDHRDEKAAPTGVVETTTVVKEYPHPSYPKVSLWDLPGIGTTKFPADEYLKHVEFERFDFFIIISDTRFRENDVKLAKEIQKMGKKFYFVRSKVDNDLQNAQRCQRDFDANQTLSLIRENCKQGLLREGVLAPQVFLLSNFEYQSHDFCCLCETLERELPQHKRDVLLFALANISLEIIEKKKEAFKSKIPQHAFLSAAHATRPVSELSVAVDADLIANVVQQYKTGFGLDRPSLQRLTDITGIPLARLTIISSHLTLQNVNADFVLSLMSQSSAISSLTEKNFLDMLTVDAKDVYTKVKMYHSGHNLLDLTICRNNWKLKTAMTLCSLQVYNQLNNFFAHFEAENNTPAQSSVSEIKEALQNNNQALAVSKIKELLEKTANTTLNIGITGESGSGKSSFVNAFRGVDHRDEKAAPTGVVETTTVVKEYPHPSYPKVSLWDLPGIGTTKFPADEYLKHVGFERFDFFIIISDTRFRENDVKLAKEIQKMGKKFYFVRSKVDNDLQNAQRSQRDFDANQTLSLIRENCEQGLLKEGVQAPQVFLLSNFELQRHDFHHLHETLERELPDHKKNVLLFAMPNVSLEIIEKKKEAFSSKIPHYAFVSAACAAVPVPGLSVAVDGSLIAGVVQQYKTGFGLDIPSLQRLANSTGVSLEALTSVVRS